MSENTTNQDSYTGKEKQNQKDDLFERTKKFADQAEGYAAKATAKIRESEAFGKFTEAFRKVSDYMDEKSEEFNKSDLSEKLDAFKEKTIKETEKYLFKAKKAGQEMADDLDEAFDLLKKKGQKPKQD
jgi:hypothetical protein